MLSKPKVFRKATLAIDVFRQWRVSKQVTRQNDRTLTVKYVSCLRTVSCNKNELDNNMRILTENIEWNKSCST